MSVLNFGGKYFLFLKKNSESFKKILMASVLHLSLPSALKKGVVLRSKSYNGKKLFWNKSKINLDGKSSAFTFALPIKKRAFFKGKKNE